MTATASYPLKVEPSFRERIWGQEEISFLYTSRPAEPRRIGEVWLTADENRLTNGIWAGKTLGELCRAHGPGLPGTPGGEPGNVVPLVKFLFAAEKLSVQVHPSDEYARKNEGCAGKTEMWHVLQAEADACLAIGLRGGCPDWQTDLRAFRESVESGDIERMLNWIPVQAGDSFFIPAGTVHALGAGLTVCEIQQNSDITYRLYDYNRLGTDGRPRTLHIEKAFSVLQRQSLGGRVTPLKQVLREGTRLCLTACPYFVTEKWTLHDPMTYATEHQFQVWVGLEGEAVVQAGGQQVACGRGEVVVIPPPIESFSVFPVGSCSFLRTHPPKLQEDCVSEWRQLGFSDRELSFLHFPLEFEAP